MADAEQVRILRSGVEKWNAFVRNRRIENEWWRADFTGASFARADLMRADLMRADFSGADLSGADLTAASLPYAVLDANLTGANLTGVNLYAAKLHRTDFSAANLTGADLTGARLSGARLSGANLTRCACLRTVFATISLAHVNGLASVRHRGSSSVDTHTLVLSAGKIPDVFLKGCGLADWEIENAKLYDSDLTEAERIDIHYEVIRLQGSAPVQINPIFLSHSSEDHKIATKLHDKLQGDGFRCWYDKHDMVSGPLDQQIDRAIQTHPIVVLVLSEASVKSDWVMWEASKAREYEKSSDRPALCPIALDRAWEDCDWPGWLRMQIERYHVVPFDELGFDEGYRRLKEGLGIYYPGESDG